MAQFTTLKQIIAVLVAVLTIQAFVKGFSQLVLQTKHFLDVERKVESIATWVATGQVMGYSYSIL